MLQNFEVLTPLFEGQVNERYQFKLTLEGNDFRGVFHDDEVHWFHPQPHNTIENYDADIVESNIRNKMTSLIQ